VCIVNSDSKSLTQQRSGIKLKKTDITELEEIAKQLDDLLSRITVGNDEMYDLLSTAHSNMTYVAGNINVD